MNLLVILKHGDARVSFERRLKIIWRSGAAGES
jgi:hypothetical protein